MWSCRSNVRNVIQPHLIFMYDECFCKWQGQNVVIYMSLLLKPAREGGVMESNWMPRWLGTQSVNTLYVVCAQGPRLGVECILAQYVYTSSEIWPLARHGISRGHWPHRHSPVVTVSVHVAYSGVSIVVQWSRPGSVVGSMSCVSGGCGSRSAPSSPPPPRPWRWSVSSHTLYTRFFIY